MRSFKVVKIIDEKTIWVQPHWIIDFDGLIYDGDEIEIEGFSDLIDRELATEILTTLVLNRAVELWNPRPIELDASRAHMKIVCQVWLEGTEIGYYFQSFKPVPAKQKKAELV